MSEERDYLVIYEEPDPYGLPTDETLILGIQEKRRRLPQVDVRHRVDLHLSNTTNKLGTIGFIVTVLGAVLGVVAILVFATSYPDQWYDDERQLQVSNLAQILTPLGAVATLTMIVGALMTHYGKRIEARGNLAAVRIIEKSPHNRIQIK